MEKWESRSRAEIQSNKACKMEGIGTISRKGIHRKDRCRESIITELKEERRDIQNRIGERAETE